MLGKNYVKQINGLGALDKLDVLDMHANLLTSTAGLENLVGLRRSTQPSDQKRRGVKVSAPWPSLTYVEIKSKSWPTSRDGVFVPTFVSFNSIQKWEDIWCLSDMPELVELTLGKLPPGALVDQSKD